MARRARKAVPNNGALARAARGGALASAPPKPKPTGKLGSDKLADEYRDWVLRQPCLYEHTGQCAGAIQPHHYGNRGTSQKASHFLRLPLCDWHHNGEFHKKGSCGGDDPHATRFTFRIWQAENLAAFLEAAGGHDGS